MSCVRLACMRAVATSFIASRSAPIYLRPDLLAIRPATSSALSAMTLQSSMYLSAGSALAVPRLLYCSNASKKYEYAVL